MDINTSVDIGKNTKEILEKIATTLGTTVDKILPIYVKQVTYEALIGILTPFVMFSVFITLFVICFLRARKEDEFEAFAVMSIILGFAAFCTLIMCFACINTNLPNLLNPEYAAIKMVLTQISGIIK